MKRPLRPRESDLINVSPATMNRKARRGELERIARGVYLPPELLDGDWDQLEAIATRSTATICLISALAHHDLTDEIPTKLDIAIPRGSRRPRSNPSIAWHVFDPTSFEVGREITKISGTEAAIAIYSAERSIIDAFRLRGDIGYEIGRDALKVWLKRGGKPAALMELSKHIPRSQGPLLSALEFAA